MLALLLALAGQATTPAAPAQSPVNWFSADDYPAAALQRRSEGTVEFRVIVDPQGMPTECIVESSSGDADLDETTCRIMLERARFTPARDEASNAVAGFYSSRIQWRMPETGGDQRPAFAPVQIAIAMRVRLDNERECNLALNGAATQVAGPDACIMFRGSNAASVLERLGPGSAIAIVETLVPNGAEPPRGIATSGEPVYQSRVRIAVSPAGHVLECSPIAERWIRQVPGLGTPTGLCVGRYSPLGRNPFHPDTGRSENASAEATIEIFLDEGTSRR